MGPAPPSTVESRSVDDQVALLAAECERLQTLLKERDAKIAGLERTVRGLHPHGPAAPIPPEGPTEPPPPSQDCLPRSPPQALSEAPRFDVSRALSEEGESRFRRLFEETSEATLLILDGQFIDANRAALRLLEFARIEQLRGKTPDEISPLKQPDGELSSAKAASLIDLTYAKGSHLFEWVHVKSSGEPIIVEVRLTPIEHPTAKFLHVVWRDITERKRTSALRNLLAEIVENTSDFVATASTTGEVTYLNRAARRMLGVDPELPAKSTSIEGSHPRWAAKLVLEQGIPTALAKGIWSGETAFINHRNDKITRVLQVILTHRNEQGEVESISTIARDIEQLKVTEEALRDKKTQLDLALRSSRLGVWHWDLKPNLCSFDTQGCLLLGLAGSVDRHPIESFYSILHPDDAVRVRRALESTARTGLPYEEEYRVVFPDGSIAHLCARGRLVRSREGQAIRIDGLLWDVSERKRAEEASARLAAIVEGADDAIISHNLDGSIATWNDGAKRLYGYDASEIIGTNAAQLIPDSARERESALYDLLGHGESMAAIETLRRRKDGTTFDVALRISALRNSQDKLVGFSIIARDISHRKRTERLLKARINLLDGSSAHTLERLLRITLDEIENLTSSSIGFYHFVEADQENLRLQTWSSNTLSRMGSAPSESRHYPVSQVGAWVDCVRERKPVIHNDYASLSHRRGLPEGHSSIRREMVVPILRHGLIVALVGVGNKESDYDETDVQITQLLADYSWEIVERKRLELAQKRLVEELSRSNTDLEQFAYVASHDLKAPLRAIDNLAGWIEEDLGHALTGESRTHLTLLRQRTARMTRLLDDLLLYSRAGRVDTDIAPTNVRELFFDIVDFLAPPDGFSFTWLGPDYELATAATPLRQVLTNLLSNAIKHHDKSDGVITGSLRETGDFIEFRIGDDGPGIAPQHHERVFGMFQTLRRRDELDSSGIGLALVRRLVTHYGGAVGIKDTTGRGTTFEFTWPKRIAAGESVASD